jgi:hypothetical protein
MGSCRRRRRCRASYRPVKPINLIRLRRVDIASSSSAAPTWAESEAAARVLPSCSVVRRDCAVDPSPLALRAASHVGLNLDPVRARAEHRWSGQIYRKHAAALHCWLVCRAVNLCARKAGAVGVKEDIPIGRTYAIIVRAIEVRPLSINRLHVPVLASWHDKVISEIGVVRRRVAKCCRHRAVGPGIVVLIVKNYLRTRCARTVSAAGVHKVAVVFAAPNDHFTAGPHCGGLLSASGCASDAGADPTVSAWIISAAGIRVDAILPAPNDHLAAGPHCSVKDSGRGRVGGARSCPTIAAAIISPTSVHSQAFRAVSAPDDHSVSGPDCSVPAPNIGRIGGAGDRPTIGSWVVSATGVKKEALRLPTPDNHFTASPHCGVIHSASGSVDRAGACPTVGAGIVSAASVKVADDVPSAPDDHFVAGPDRRVIVPARRRVVGAGGCPAVGAGIVSAAGVRRGAATPDDHFSAGPHCRVIGPASGCVGGTRGCPTVGAGIVSPAGVAGKSTSAPDDHFAAGPDCCVEESGIRRASGAGRSPRVVNAATRRTSYHRKRVVSARRCHRCH